ncbi:LacI family transcriptional regulator [Roseinatronobacter monicus]|uniref:LacI family transcriptional regulator n=1 Tax=Roseinatronobacter monicus TaxID=393481 RepID=UPI003F303305
MPGSDDPTTDPRLRAGERPTLKTLARLTGLAVPTVSRALSDAPDIGLKTKEKVREFARQIGYRPDRAGVRLRTGKTNVIALILGTDQDLLSLTTRLTTSIASALRGTPYHMIVIPYFADEDPLNPVRYVVETRSADGVILNRIQPDDPRITYLRANDFPFATHGRTANCETHPYFDFDNSRFGGLCVERLVARGRRNLLALTPPVGQNFARHLIEGATDAAARLGATIELLDGTTIDAPPEEITATVAARLAQAPEIDGIICASAAAAIAAVVAAEAEGRVLGRDIDVAAKEPMPILQNFRKEMIAIPENVDQAGSFLAHAIMRAIDEPDLPPLQKLVDPD